MKPMVLNLTKPLIKSGENLKSGIVMMNTNGILKLANVRPYRSGLYSSPCTGIWKMYLELTVIRNIDLPTQ